MGRLHPIIWLRSHPSLGDLLLTIGVVALSLVIHLFTHPDPTSPDVIEPQWWTVALTVIGTAPIYWRRSHPIGVALFVVGMQVAMLLADVGGAAFLASAIAVYSLGAHATGKRRTRVLVTIAAMVIALFILGWIDGQALLDEFISTMVLLAIALVVGDNMRRRRQHVDDLVDRAERAEREQQLLAAQHVAAERTRIARELHDVVAHSVSVMVIQAAAARRSLPGSVARADAALATIESMGRQTMQELRGVLGVLRTDESATSPTLAPSPSLLDVASLAAADDLPVDVTIEGSLVDVPASVSLTGYRIVQEALTNVRRHAGHVGCVDVRVDRSPALLSITVTDDGRGAAADNVNGPGFGIAGMIERVSAVGGSVTTGPRRGGGWQVAAQIPLADERSLVQDVARSEAIESLA